MTSAAKLSKSFEVDFTDESKSYLEAAHQKLIENEKCLSRTMRQRLIIALKPWVTR